MSKKLCIAAGFYFINRILSIQSRLIKAFKKSLPGWWGGL
jgi:hypothetical protein